jgi:hypothetical protein
VYDESAPAASRAVKYDRALGVVMSTRDIEASFGCNVLDELCHPGIPVLEECFYAARDHEDEAVLAAAPRPRRLPLSFGPVAQRVMAKIYHDHVPREHSHTAYPEHNIKGRLEETLRRATDPTAYVEMDTMLGNGQTMGGINVAHGCDADAMDVDDVED